MAKRASKKKATSNVPGTDQPPLDPDWEDQIPEPVSEKVDVYLKAMRAKNKAAEKEKKAKSDAIDSMKEHGLTKIRIDEGKKWLICEDTPKLVTKSVPKKELDEA